MSDITENWLVSSEQDWEDRTDTADGVFVDGNSLALEFGQLDRSFNEDPDDNGDLIISDGEFGLDPEGYFANNLFIHDNRPYLEAESRTYTVRLDQGSSNLNMTIRNSEQDEAIGRNGFEIEEHDSDEGQTVDNFFQPDVREYEVVYTGNDFEVYDESGELIHEFGFDLSGYNELYISIYEFAGGQDEESLRLTNVAENLERETGTWKSTFFEDSLELKSLVASFSSNVVNLDPESEILARIGSDIDGNGEVNEFTDYVDLTEGSNSFDGQTFNQDTAEQHTVEFEFDRKGVEDRPEIDDFELVVADRPEVEVLEADNITVESADLRLDVLDLFGYDSFFVTFEYRELGSEDDWIEEDFGIVSETGVISQNISGLEDDVAYEFRVNVSYEGQSFLTETSEFKTLKDADFQVEITDFDQSVRQPEEAEITFEVTNIGDVEGETDVFLAVDDEGQVIDEILDVTIDSQTIFSDTFVIDSTEFELGFYDFIVFTEDDSESVEIAIAGEEEVALSSPDDGEEFSFGDEVVFEFLASPLESNLGGPEVIVQDPDGNIILSESFSSVPQGAITTNSSEPVEMDFTGEFTWFIEYFYDGETRTSETRTGNVSAEEPNITITNPGQGDEYSLTERDEFELDVEAFDSEVYDISLIVQTPVRSNFYTESFDAVSEQGTESFVSEEINLGAPGELLVRVEALYADDLNVETDEISIFVEETPVDVEESLSDLEERQTVDFQLVAEHEDDEAISDTNTFTTFKRDYTFTQVEPQETLFLEGDELVVDWTVESFGDFNEAQDIEMAFDDPDNVVDSEQGVVLEEGDTISGQFSHVLENIPVDTYTVYLTTFDDEATFEIEYFEDILIGFVSPEEGETVATRNPEVSFTLETENEGLFDVFVDDSLVDSIDAPVNNETFTIPANVDLDRDGDLKEFRIRFSSDGEDEVSRSVEFFCDFTRIFRDTEQFPE